MKIIYAGLCAVLLAGCSTTVSNNVVQDTLGSGPVAGKVISDAEDAKFNLTQAVAVGALAADDPGPACVQQAYAQLGIGGAPAPSFQAKVSGALSFTALAYIRAQQVKKMQGTNIALPAACEQLLGRMQLDAVAAALKAQTGGNLLPVLQ